MLKLTRSGIALLLGLLMAITLLVPGAFAQRVDAHHGSVTPSVTHAVATAVLTGVSQSAQTTTHQQATQPLSMNRHGHHFHRGWGGGGWGWGGSGWGWGGSGWGDGCWGCGCW